CARRFYDGYLSYYAMDYW
nr:immunoglobulin heavy chain junction region [Mus musculus]MBK4185555.1 immunoglobulin heavy chain junction region [Mus musculus]MBK4185556.1 immunoglobulin heavy chain junction region [Mus musculus]MBK4185560.1 immunoglobulin heavy chain junction region [Mus musculus]MBK4185561.1 immunoglobulin heavy chain junction region [Mus musculus]